MPGVLKVQTAPGVWTSVGGQGPPGVTQDVLHVGTAAPVDPTVELWWDSDEPAPTPPTFTQVEADPLYVNIPGDTMTGRLNISDPNNTPSVPLVMTTTGGAASLMAIAGGTNWLGRLTFFDVGGIAIATEDADQPVKILVNNADRIVVGAADVQISTPVGITSSSASAPLNLKKSDGKPGINFLSDTAGGLGYIAADETLNSVDLVASPASSFVRIGGGNVETARFRQDMLMVGRTLHDFVDTGWSILTNGAATVVTDTAVYTNYCHAAASDVNGALYFNFTRAANVKIGGIAQTSTTGVAFQTTSHAGWKGNVRDVTDDEALARVETWRPVAFQWKMDAQGNLREDGTPTGDVQIGFIAQELVALEPTAGTTGFGTQVEHDEWMTRFNAEAAAGRSLEDPEPFQPGMTDASKLVPALAAAVRALIHKVAVLEGGTP